MQWSVKIECIRKRVMRIVLPDLEYKDITTRSTQYSQRELL